MSSPTGAGTDPLSGVLGSVGRAQYEETGQFPVERGYIWTSCASVENGNPLFWEDAAAEAITAGPIAPPTMLSVWFRPHHWAPGRKTAHLPLQVHFDLKDRLGLPEAVMTENTIVFCEPVRVGDLLRTRQILRSISDEKSTKLGTGRFWVIDVEYENQSGDLVGVETYTGFGYRRHASDAARSALSSAHHVAGSSTGHTGGPEVPETREMPRSTPAPRAGYREPALLLGAVAEGDRLPVLTHDVTATSVVLGALASRDWRPMHHDKDFAVNRNGTKDIFINTPNQAAWFERYITDWTGPHGRLGSMRFRMRGSVFPGDAMVFEAVVDEVGLDRVRTGWVGIDVTLSVDGEVRTSCQARVAVPVDDRDNPWERRGGSWMPQGPAQRR